MEDNVAGQQLLLDYEFKFPGDPTACDGWAYPWESAASVGTTQPTPRPGHATLIVNTSATDNPVHDLAVFFQSLQRLGGLPIQLQVGSTTPTSSNSSSDRADVNILSAAPTGDGGGTNNQCWATGTVDRTCDPQGGDPNIGYYAMLQSTSAEGDTFLQDCRMRGPPGFVAYIPHDQRSIEIAGGYVIETRTGWGPDLDSNHKGQAVDLATRFTLWENRDRVTQVARCHVSYRDGSSDPSIGPTIERLAVYQDFRGRGLLPLFFHWILDSMRISWSLECLNTEVPPGRVMIKVSQLTNAVVDTKEDGELITDKEFFYRYAGFGVRLLQGGAAGARKGGNRPKDEEAVRYYPMLTPQDLHDQSSPETVVVPWEEDVGSRTCDFCAALKTRPMRCSRCRQAFYCDKDCQRQDWKRHKQWCNKSKEEVHDKLVELGLRVCQDDGTYTSVRDELAPGLRL